MSFHFGETNRCGRQGLESLLVHSSQGLKWLALRFNKLHQTLKKKKSVDLYEDVKSVLTLSSTAAVN